MESNPHTCWHQLLRKMKMRRILFAFAVALFIATLSSPVRAESSGVIGQAVRTGDLKTTVHVSPFGRYDWMVEFKFESKTYPIGCLSAYRDARYELRDSRNQIIPVDQQTLAHPPYDGPSVVEPVSVRFGQPNCSSPSGVWLTRAKISALYPNLETGAYTLKVSLSPRPAKAPALLPQIEFAPVTISISKPSEK
jgi:hypothetical protein